MRCKHSILAHSSHHCILFQFLKYIHTYIYLSSHAHHTTHTQTHSHAYTHTNTHTHTHTLQCSKAALPERCEAHPSLSVDVTGAGPAEGAAVGGGQTEALHTPTPTHTDTHTHMPTCTHTHTHTPEHEALQFDTKNGRLLFRRQKLLQIFKVHSQREHTLVVLYACSYIICLLFFTCLFFLVFLVCLLFTGPTVLVFRSPHTRTMPQAMSLPWTHSDVNLESGHPLPSNKSRPLIRYLWSERLADQPAGLFCK